MTAWYIEIVTDRTKTTSFYLFKHLGLLVERRRFGCFAPKRRRFGSIGNNFGTLCGHCSLSLIRISWALSFTVSFLK